MRAFIALVLFVFLAQPIHAANVGAGRQYFHDWLATCPTDGYCSATASVNPSAGNGTAADYVLRIGRPAQQTYWEISFSANAAEVAPHSDIGVTVDGKAESFASPGAVAAYGSARDFYFLGKGAQNIMDRLAHGTALGVSFTDSQGGLQHANFALSGVTAALLWIDTQQHRIGSERVAEAPPYGLQAITDGPLETPGAPAPLGASPLSLTAVPPVLLAQIDADSGCSLKDPPLDQIKAADLGDGYTLFVVPCIAGAHNAAEKAYLGYDWSYYNLALPQVSATGAWTATSLLFNSGFDPATLTLTSTYHGDAPGSCGSAGKWMWLDAPGYVDKAFTLVEFRAKPACDGKPGDFPVLYPAAR